MPKFKPNTSSAMKMKSVYKMKYQGNHSAFPFKSPLEYEKKPVGPVVKDEKEKFVESLGGLKDPNINKPPVKPTTEKEVVDQDPTVWPLSLKEDKPVEPKVPEVEHKSGPRKNPTKPKKGGWFNLPDLGITEALDAMTKKQKEGGTGFYRKKQ